MNSFSNSTRAAIDRMVNSPPEAIAETVRDVYPAITIEDATRIRDGLGAIMTAGTKEEANRLKADYKALHKELKIKYRGSGIPTTPRHK